MVKKRNKKRNLIFCLGLLCLAVTMVATGVVMSNDGSSKFSKNVYINGTNVGGYTKTEAVQVVTEKLNAKVDNLSIELLHYGKSWRFDHGDFQVDNAVSQVVNSAYSISKLGEKQTLKYLAENGANFNVALNLVIKNFDQTIDEIAEEIYTEPQNAFVEFTPNEKQNFNVVTEKQGEELDKEMLMQKLEDGFLNGDDIKIEIPTKKIEPEIKADFFADKLNLQSKFSTSIKNSQSGRRHNVALALKKLNGTIVKPNEIKSFNQIVGPQTESGGYESAIIIINGAFKNGIGGGICQASTTLYNALLLADVEVDEVHKHTLPVKYVEMALDAMVSEGTSDLVFKNTSDNDLYIKSYVKGDDATVEIYGKSLPDGVTVKRSAEFIKSIPHSGDKIIVDTNGEYRDKVIYKGEYYRLKYPVDGYEAKAYKEYYKDGKLIDKQEIRHEKYSPQQGIVIEGAEDLPEGFVLPKQEVKIIKPNN